MLPTDLFLARDWRFGFHRRALRSAAAAALAGALVSGALSAATREGDRFPKLDPATLDGAVPDVEGQVTVVDFWASWCAPCKASFSAYARIHADYAARGVRVVAVSVDQDPAAYAEFIRRHAPPFAVLRDRDQKLVRQVEVPAMPTSFLVGRDGRVRAVHQGFRGAETEAALRRELDQLLAQ